MRLDYNTVKAITKGAVRVEEDNGFLFFRFTKGQERQYEKYHRDLLGKTYSTAGICLEFETDTCNLHIDAHISESTTRKFYFIEVFCDGKLVDEISNFTPKDGLFDDKFKLGRVQKNITLPKGAKKVKIVLPWSVRVKINEISIDDGSFIRPEPEREKMLFFGDSITHGYDALRPSESYVYRISQLLDVDAFNKAIGAEVFFPQLLEEKDDFSPKYISVAYGTNDWNVCTFEELKENCSRFFGKLAELYPTAKIFALTPTWRRDGQEERRLGDFKRVRDYIFQTADDFKNVFAVDGYDFVPHDEEKFFSDKRIHPNSEGFKHYTENLFSAIKNYI